jgi:hypothetical protein
VIGDDGGHMHSNRTLNKVVQAFGKRYNGCYFPIDTLISKGEKLLDASPITDAEVNSYVTKMYV